MMVSLSSASSLFSNNLSHLLSSLQHQLTSPGSVASSRGSSVPGSPSSIVARMDNEVLGYKDLAAIPKDKAILDIERPDLMIYEPHFTYSLLDHATERPRSREVTRDSVEGKSPSNASQAALRRAGSAAGRLGVHHFHHPDPATVELNIYKKPPIYKQRELPTTQAHPQVGKHLIEDQIIESSKFPAAQPPDPNLPAKIETDYWPCPPSLAVVETEWRQRKASRRGGGGEGEEEEEAKDLREVQEEELSKVGGEKRSGTDSQGVHLPSDPAVEEGPWGLPCRAVPCIALFPAGGLQPGEAHLEGGDGEGALAAHPEENPLPPRPDAPPLLQLQILVPSYLWEKPLDQAPVHGVQPRWEREEQPR
uniref:Putative adherens-junction anchoring domain-containing protein n=1 Tax=Anolis carolinensis TaxID=28377 RepID=H9G4G2_ANOCA